jgi:hypothetical protein
MRWTAGARHVVAVRTAIALCVVLATGCGGEHPESDAGGTPRARVGPTCTALRMSNDPEYDAYESLIDFVYESEAGAGARYDSLTGGQRMLWATLLLEGEVNNGGFNQYFFNTQGEFLADAIRGFEVFGAREHGTLARQAREAYANDKERLAKARDEGTLQAFSDSYDEDPYQALDSEFFELASPPGRVAYVKSHLREFCVVQ